MLQSHFFGQFGASRLIYVIDYSVLSPVLNMPISDSKRQRVLVASCVLYSEVSFMSTNFGLALT